MTQRKDTNNDYTGRELVITRLLNAPVDLVWEVWTNPDHIKNWWGPNGFTNTILTMDVKPGGVWDFVMHGPDGKDYKNKSIYKEIVKHKKIVFDHLNPNFTATITFEDRSGKTFLSWQMLFDTTQEFDTVVKVFKADEGIKQNVTKLDAYVMNLNAEPIVIERIYNAPVAKVWAAITDNAQMKKWYFDIADFKPEVGFEFQFAGQGKDGEKYVHLCKVTEVVKEKKLTHSWRYEGFEGNSFVTWELFPEAEKTKVRLTHAGLETFPATANNAFAKENFATGWAHITGISLKEFIEPKD